jgi:hypothetical protein
MKKFAIIAICIFLICAAMFYFISMPRNLSGVTATDGVLDLRGEDFSKTIFRLDGEWEFYYGQLLTPEDFASGIPTGSSLIQVPMSWDAAGYPRLGYATYRLIIKTNEPKLLMLIPEIAVSSIVWINGERIFDAGKVSADSTEVIFSHRSALVSYQPENGQAEIIIQAANSRHHTSGLNFSIEIGRNNILFSDAMSRRVLLCVFIGLALAIAFYHLMLYINRRREFVYLYFALYCFVKAVRFIFEIHSLAQLLLPGGM